MFLADPAKLDTRRWVSTVSAVGPNIVHDRDVVAAVAASLGCIWRKKRRQLPRGIQEPFLDLLLACGAHVRPDGDAQCVTSIKQAKVEVKQMANLLCALSLRSGGYADSDTAQVICKDLDCDAGDCTAQHVSSQVEVFGALVMPPPPAPPWTANWSFIL